MEVEDRDGGSDERWTYAWTLVNLASMKIFNPPELRIPIHGKPKGNLPNNWIYHTNPTDDCTLRKEKTKEQKPTQIIALQDRNFILTYFEYWDFILVVVIKRSNVFPLGSEKSDNTWGVRLTLSYSRQMWLIYIQEGHYQAIMMLNPQSFHPQSWSKEGPTHRATNVAIFSLGNSLATLNPLWLAPLSLAVPKPYLLWLATCDEILSIDDWTWMKNHGNCS